MKVFIRILLFAFIALNVKVVGATVSRNLLVDAATGNLPDFNNGWDVAKYAGGLALDGLGAGGAGTLARTGLPKLASLFSSRATVSMGGRSGATIVNHLADGFEAVANYEVIIKPAIKGFGQNTLAQGIRQGLNFADEAGKGGTNLVYQGFDKAGVVRYVGITERAAGVRFGEHLSSGTAKSLLRYEVVPGATNLSRTGARVWEQGLVNQYGLQKNGGLLLNKIK